MIRFLLATTATLLIVTPALAQDSDPVLGKRVGKLESEMRAVQRKVFPGGDARYFEPEIAPAQAAPPETVGSPALAPLADLTTRVGEIETQLRTLTGQVEAQQNRLRLLEEAQTKFRADTEFRLTTIEGGGKSPVAAVPGGAAPPEATDGPAPAPKPAATKPDTAPATPEAQWRAAYALVIAKNYDEAEPALQDFIAANPKSTRASDAQYWLGKTYAAQDQPAQAAKAYLDGYQKFPKGTRAPDSLLGLSQALIDLKKPQQACRSLNELDAVYAAKLTPALKAQAAKARTTAKCTG
ncbi:tetratricopeptide repeat protein [Glacieibacterium sp.]|uniref:tetratricopeptide repeat protein n=1 Tax=Glacieibacterium sp. TaxID=2860237 RepID=UPI003AFFA0B3